MATYLTRTQVTGTNRKICTVSMWIKKTENAAGHEQYLFHSWADGNNRFMVALQNDDTLQVRERSGGSTTLQIDTNRKFKDTHAWYHIVVRVDTTQSTAADRIRIYINGVQETSFSGASYPSQNLDLRMGTTDYTHYLGEYGGGGNNFSGVASHWHFADGQSLAPTVFGSTDTATGEWKINTNPSGITYGNNGFFLFKDDNSVNDDSGEGHNFTLASGTLTKTEDNPSNVFATINAQIGDHSNGSVLVPTLENSNTTSVYGSSQWRIAQSTLAASSGKWYAEFKWVDDSNTRYSYIGLYDIDGYAEKITGYPYMADMANCYGLKDSNGNIHTGGSGTSYGVSYGPSNIIGVAADLDNNKLYFSKDGVWMNSANPSNGTGGHSITANKTYVFGIQQYAAGSLRFAHNYGNGYFQSTAVSSAGSNASNNGIFEYDVPTGFTALSTKGLNL